MKRLITAEVIRQERNAGKTTIEVTLPQCIVTPEARLVAEQLQMTIHETLDPLLGKSDRPRNPAKECPIQVADTVSPDLARVRAEVMARLPAGVASEELITQLVQKVAAEQKSVANTVAGTAVQPAPTAGPGRIKRIAADSVKFGLFEGAGRDKQVGIVDVVTAEDGSSMAAGFMTWKKCFFPWTLTYDEVDYVIEGELHIRCNGQTVVGKVGDVIFIPKGSAIEFGTTTEVRFLYVAYPANWQDI